MGKFQDYSRESKDKMANQKKSCVAEASSDTCHLNGNAWEKPLVNSSYSSKVAVNNCAQKINGHLDKSSKNTPIVNSSSTSIANNVQGINGHCETSIKEAVNENSNNASVVNGHCGVLSTCKINFRKACNPNNAARVNNILAVYRTCDEVRAEEVPVEKENGNTNSKDYINSFSTSSVNETSSSVLTSNSLDNGNISDENQHGFIEVVNKKKRNKNRRKYHQKKTSPNLPFGLVKESTKRDNENDKISILKTSSHLLQKPPSRNFTSIRSSAKSYSSVLTNGQTGNYRVRNGELDISSDPKVTSSTKSSKPLSGACASVDKLSAELNKSVINDNISTKIKKIDNSAQTDIYFESETSPCQKECLLSEEAVIESEKASSPSDYGDMGEISDESSNITYCESVDSNDSGRGDSEIIYHGKMPYCCEFPKEKSSQLIGRGGNFKYEIERKSGIRLRVLDHEYDNNLSIVCMTGTGAQIENAKKLIKERFRHVTLRQWLGYNPINPPLSDRYLPILPQGTDSMGVVSCICDPSFFWVQQYAHPHWYSLEDLERRMSVHFNTVTDAPAIDNPTIGSVIAVPGVKEGDNLKWIRGCIVSVISEEEVVVRYLDHGGDHLVPINSIRPMRHDFFSMPFFAAQCSLYDILPAGGAWTDDARAEFTRLCHGSTHPPLVRVVCKTPEFYYVNLFGYDSETDAQVNIATHLITKGYGVRPCIPVTKFHTELQQ